MGTFCFIPHVLRLEVSQSRGDVVSGHGGGVGLGGLRGLFQP